MLDSLAERFDRAFTDAKHKGKVKAVTIAVSQTAGTSVQDLERAGYVWVRLDETDTQTLTDDARATVSVRCFKAADFKEGVYVEIEKDKDGEWHVAGLDEAAMLDAYGGLATSFTMPLRAGEIALDIIPGWRFKPLRVRPDISGGLNVVIEPGVYTYLDATYAYLDATPIDLATIPVTANMKRAVIIGVDPTTNAATTAYGDEVPKALPAFTLTDYAAVATTNTGMLWLFGYERRDGVTAFESLYDLTDIRAYVDTGGGIASGDSFMPIELTFALTIPTNRQTAVRRLIVGTGGALTVNGALDIF